MKILCKKADASRINFIADLEVVCVCGKEYWECSLGVVEYVI